MFYFGKEKLLVTGSYDSLIKVYNDQEELSITGILSGGNIFQKNIKLIIFKNIFLKI